MAAVTNDWKDVFWNTLLRTGDGYDHPVLPPEVYDEAMRADEKDKLFYCTQEYYDQNKIIAKNVLKRNELSLPFRYLGSIISLFVFIFTS